MEEYLNLLQSSSLSLSHPLPLHLSVSLFLSLSCANFRFLSLWLSLSLSCSLSRARSLSPSLSLLIQADGGASTRCTDGRKVSKLAGRVAARSQVCGGGVAKCIANMREEHPLSYGERLHRGRSTWRSLATLYLYISSSHRDPGSTTS